MTSQTADEVWLTMTDKGHGMSRAVFAQAVDPFFTTRTTSGGTGLGLSMVYGFAKQSGGDIHIDSQPGDGTTVRLIFPRSILPEATTTPPTPLRNALLVEDDDADLTLAKTGLESARYRLAPVQSFTVAKDTITEGQPFDLLLPDLHLDHGQRSIDLVASFVAHNPDAIVILASGRFHDTNHFDWGPARLVDKPMTPQKLTRALQQLSSLERLSDVVQGKRPAPHRPFNAPRCRFVRSRRDAGG